MQDSVVLTPKSAETLRRKNFLNHVFNIVIAVLGITSLYEKFFLIDGVIAFRAFTVDGNLFTTIVAVIAVISGIVDYWHNRESNSRALYFLELCSAVSEAVIFIVVMVGYLPFVSDTPQITPYHMFCLHVAIPVLSVVRFIFFQKPIGFIKPSKLMCGAIPIGVYGIGVVSAIKLGILPTSFVPYSFLDFQHNYIWYFLFALFAIPGFGFLWSLIFYRLNLKAAALWYKMEDIVRLNEERKKGNSRFDAVNSGIAIVFSLLSILLLSFSLMTNSNTSTTVQNDLMKYVSYLMLENYDTAIGYGDWHMEDGNLYRGEYYFTDGTDEELSCIESDVFPYNLALYVKASELKPEVAAKYNPDDFVVMVSSIGKAGGPYPNVGDVMESNAAKSVIKDETGWWCETVKYQRALTEEEEKYKEQLRNTKESYYHYLQTCGDETGGEAWGLIEMYIPAASLTEQVKDAEFSSDFIMASIIIAIFGILYIVTHRWIVMLEKSVGFLKTLALGGIPEEPLKVRANRDSGLVEALNKIREDRIKQQNGAADSK